MNLTGSAWRGVCLTLAVAGAALAQPAATPAQPAPAAPVAPAAPPAPVATTPSPAAAPATPAAPVEIPVSAPAEKKPVVPPKPAAPMTRARSNIAILQALDKVTAETIRFEAPVGQPVRYKTLVFTVRACETTAPDEPVQDYSAYVLIDSQALPTPGKAAPPARQAFRGWMYARSPGLNPLQHPVYDAWLISCRTSAPGAAAAPPAKR